MPNLRLFSVITILVLAVSTLSSQTPVGTWSDHLSYNTALNVAAGSENIYASTGSSVLVYNKSLSELRKITRINGLSETGISNIAWSEANKTLVIAYISTNIDLVCDNAVSNIPDILRKYIPGRKTINRIRVNGKYAYLACSFGIVVVDMSKKEIYDTWKPRDVENPEVWDIAFLGNRIYAATDAGIFSATISDPGLAYYGNWDLLTDLPAPAGKYTLLLSVMDKLYANLADPSGDIIYAIGEGSTVFLNQPGVINSSLDLSPNGFTVSSGFSVKFFHPDGTLQRTISSYDWALPAASQAVADNGDIWIADINRGLVCGHGMTSFEALTISGPASNNAFNITSNDGKTIICGGGATVTWNSQNRPMQVSVHEDNSWTYLTPENVTDPMRALIDPDDRNHIFISTWGRGLLEYRNGSMVRYDQDNSPLQTIIPGAPFVRICGLAMDQQKNLWITQTEVPGSIKVLKHDGSWLTFPFTIEALTIGDIIIAKNGFKWVVLPRGYGIFILDDNNTPGNFTDDRSMKILIRDNENNIVSNVYSIAEDLEGNIWVGTDQGPFVYYNPERIFDQAVYASRIKIPRNDGTDLADYLLATETITSIAVDGADRKWFGTSGSGAYLVSADGITRIRHFNDENSPILSNTVVSLAVDNKTGDVWFGTSKGIQSFRGDASKGNEKFSSVYAFPNPVREDFTGNVTITGLVLDTEIKITDISGNLVYETMSDGGMASWDLKNYKGQRVSTGVYLVFCSSPGGKEATVTKILVIN